jgi:cell division GTPase FtsZ
MNDRVDALRRTLADELEGESGGEGEDHDQVDVPFTFLFLGLGGGTGCGIAPYVAEAVEGYTDGSSRIIAVCVLPNTQGPVGESDGDTEARPSRQAWNASYGLDRLEDAVDGIVLVDNQRLSYHEAAEGQFTEFNEYIAGCIVDLISGPTLERIDRSEYDVDPPIIDIQDIVTTLSFGMTADETETGYASMGRAVVQTSSMLGYLAPVVGKKTVDAVVLSSMVEMKQTLSDVDLAEATKAIGLLRAPNRYIADTDYQIDTSKLRSFLASRCDEINLGATLTNRRLASFTTLFTYRREELSRLAEIEELAEGYEQEREQEVAVSSA